MLKSATGVTWSLSGCGSLSGHAKNISITVKTDWFLSISYFFARTSTADSAPPVMKRRFQTVMKRRPDVSDVTERSIIPQLQPFEQLCKRHLRFARRRARRRDASQTSPKGCESRPGRAVSSL